eukprot:CAMPEP_0194204902 /NCGR_PEP_ID=MMETSP0156-20130528/4304_1 /TAXON_ID=33649 /ORGANISM="Thalassionema nitzschioides, Strain L26-B" /LENGTH=48 /DNA_ID= /DNA_START= /DNA_END= /DNA_ORIENTATION=
MALFAPKKQPKCESLMEIAGKTHELVLNPEIDCRILCKDVVSKGQQPA